MRVEGPRPFGACHSQRGGGGKLRDMILFIALSVSLAAATVLLVQQYRSRALADADTPAGDPAERALDERRAA